MNLDKIIEAAKLVAPALHIIPAMRALFDNAVQQLKEPDQDKAKAYLAELRNANDKLNARLQDKLR